MSDEVKLGRIAPREREGVSAVVCCSTIEADHRLGGRHGIRLTTSDVKEHFNMIEA
ncbi:hypothetical protein [Bradyrhizobium sp. B117]|uniref:hypothetical protein n=1 Tax=Bradyrhizobium sp. B117 TaxID=3140246 RepID=UPI00318383B8